MTPGIMFLRVVLRQVAVSLALTVLLEGVFCFLCGMRKVRPQGKIALINLVTNPAAVSLFYAYYYFGPQRVIEPLPAQLILEAGVVLCEWRMIRALFEEIRRPFLWSFSMNLFSWGMWYLLERIIRG